MPTPTVEVQVLETRVDLSNDMTWKQMIGVGVRNVVLREGSSINSRGQIMPRGERTAELRRAAREAARARQTAAASQNEAEESDESEDETAGERTRTRVRRTRGGMKVAARIGEKLRREIGSGRRPRVGDG